MSRLPERVERIASGLDAMGGPLFYVLPLTEGEFNTMLSLSPAPHEPVWFDGWGMTAYVRGESKYFVLFAQTRVTAKGPNWHKLRGLVKIYMPHKDNPELVAYTKGLADRYAKFYTKQQGG